VQQVSCGVAFVFVPLASREAVDRAVPDPHLLDFEAYVFTMDRAGASDSAHTYSRMFAPMLGVSEDPATGGASGPLGSYLVKHSLVTPEQARSILNLQGVKLGRPSWIHVSIECSGVEITRVRVGGTSVFVAEGVMEVED
jgi:trans-2,3-dihydro-3-hydroxyanthranilate isomerase